MNERIRELMLKAGYVAPEIAIRAQKLAELIVKECSNIVLHYDSVDEGAEVMRKTFGIK